MGTCEDVSAALSGLTDGGDRYSSLADKNADLPKTIMDLQLREVAYQAALGTASRVLQPSLVAFLR